MKKSLFALASIAMLVLGSCSNDDFTPPAGSDGNVSFTVTMPAQTLSRAYADGYTAKALKVAVYETDGTNQTWIADYDGAFADGSLTTTVQMNLVKGKTYNFAFWAAAADNDAYTFDTENANVSIDYTKVALNDDKYDAFFNSVKDITVTGALQRTVELRRPFAQINVGTSDIDAAKAAGVTLETTELKVEKAYSAFNLLTGLVDPASETSVEFAAVAPSEETFPVTTTDYAYLAMCYVLTGSELTADDVQQAQPELFDVEVVLNTTDKNNAAHTVTIPVDNAPVQRNYRTNIYGALLTSPLDWTIIIEPGLNEPAHDREVIEPGKVLVEGKTYDTLAEALAAATGETPEVKLGAGEFDLPTSVAAAGRTGLTIVGSGDTKVKYPAENNIDAEGMDVAMKDLTFSTAQTSKYVGFNGANSESYENVEFVDGSLYPMAKAVEINNSTFTVNPEADTESPAKYALRFHARYVQQTAVVSNCEFTTHLSTAVAAYHSTADITFDNCKFTNIESRAVALKDAQSAISFSNATPTGEFKYNLVLNNCVATGFIGHFLSDSQLWACKTGEMASVTIDGETVHQPVVNPNGSKNYILYTPSALNVIAKIINEGYWKDGELVKNRLSGYTVLLNNDIDMAGVEFTPIGVNIAAYPGMHFAGTFDGQNHKISNLTASDNYSNHAAAGLFGGLVGTVKNLTLENPTVTSTHYAGGIAGYVDNETGSLIDNCKVIGGTITSTPEFLNGEWDNGDKVGGILGYGCVNKDKVTNCYVEGTTIKCYRHGGAVMGYLANQANMTGCSAKDVTLLWDGEHDYKKFGSVDKAPFGVIAGNITGEFNDNTATNVTLPQ